MFADADNLGNTSFTSIESHLRTDACAGMNFTTDEFLVQIQAQIQAESSMMLKRVEEMDVRSKLDVTDRHVLQDNSSEDMGRVKGCRTKPALPPPLKIQKKRSSSDSSILRTAPAPPATPPPGKFTFVDKQPMGHCSLSQPRTKSDNNDLASEEGRDISEKPMAVLKETEDQQRVFGNVDTDDQTKTGYMGQFELPTYSQPDYDSHEQSTYLTMGDQYHPNFIYTHTKFRHASDSPPSSPDHPFLSFPSRKSCDLSGYAYKMTLAAAKLARLAEEEQMRVEAHREAAAARLDGIAVGQYRYYQGHMTVEDFVENNLCVCWDECACARMCTRWADVKCPCIAEGHILLHRREDGLLLSA